jgi:hypothetical protein
LKLNLGSNFYPSRNTQNTSRTTNTTNLNEKGLKSLDETEIDIFKRHLSFRNRGKRLMEEQMREKEKSVEMETLKTIEQEIKDQ